MTLFSGSPEGTRVHLDERTRPFETTAKSALFLFGIGFGLHLLVFLLASAIYHIPIDQFAAKGDGASYLAYAKAILGDASTLTNYDRRVFPGYPALIALFHLGGLTFPFAALLVDWLSAGVAAALSVQLFQDRRVAWAMLFLLPHYLGNSTLAMSEAPLLAFTIGGLLLALNDSPFAGGMLLGFAGLIRPMACFAAGGLLVWFLVDRRYRQALLACLGAAMLFGLGVLALHYFTGDALRGIRVYHDSRRAYGGQIFEPPFHALLTIPFREHVSAGFVTYIYCHVLVVLVGCGFIAYRVLAVDSPTRSLDLVAFTWLLGNTLFQLCIGSTWGFRHFTRFAIPAQPALFWALLPILPRVRWPWVVATCGIILLAVVSVHLTP
jgi:hypothetical protein